jgi:hypothetical protein
MTQFSEEFKSLRWTLVWMYLCIAGGLCLLLVVHVHIHRPLLMNGDEAVGSAPCTFVPSEFPILGSVSGDVFLPL